jgi:hypothetical protein
VSKPETLTFTISQAPPTIEQIEYARSVAKKEMSFFRHTGLCGIGDSIRYRNVRVSLGDKRRNSMNTNRHETEDSGSSRLQEVLGCVGAIGILMLITAFSIVVVFGIPKLYLFYATHYPREFEVVMYPIGFIYGFYLLWITKKYGKVFRLYLSKDAEVLANDDLRRCFFRFSWAWLIAILWMTILLGLYGRHS